MLFPDVSSKRAVSAFQKAGFEIVRGGGTKHIGMTDGRRRVTIPRQNRLNPYTLKGIIRDAGLTDEEFKKLL